jgi:hypothetical protein
VPFQSKSSIKYNPEGRQQGLDCATFTVTVRDGTAKKKSDGPGRIADKTRTSGNLQERRKFPPWQAEMMLYSERVSQEGRPAIMIIRPGPGVGRVAEVLV